ncbi:MAG: hypothetical protein ACYCUM_13920 [Solirubrobacteraceae bacterium]
MRENQSPGAWWNDGGQDAATIVPHTLAAIEALDAEIAACQAEDRGLAEQPRVATSSSDAIESALRREALPAEGAVPIVDRAEGAALSPGVALRDGENPSRLAAAYHAAGHAIAAAAIGLDVCGCYLDDDCVGAVHYHGEAQPAERLAVVLAGRAAQAIAFDDDDFDSAERWHDAVNDDLEELGSGGVDEVIDDVRQAALLTDRVAPIQEALHDARTFARRLLRENWRDVEAVAESLRRPSAQAGA